MRHAPASIQRTIRCSAQCTARVRQRIDRRPTMGACGSTLPVFPLFGNGARPLTREQMKLVHMYLPDFKIYEPSLETHRQIAASHWNATFRDTGSSRSSARSSTRTDNSSRRTDGRNSSAPSSSHMDKSRITTLYDAFYQYLEEHSPELKPVFRSSMHVRSKVLVHISAGMRTILSSDGVAEKMAALTRTHMRFGVKLEYFNPLGLALMHAMREASGELWSPEIEDAWRRLFVHCSAILLVHHKRAQEERVTAPPKQLDPMFSGPVLYDLPEESRESPTKKHAQYSSPK
ncbi:hypothetical protein P43SY_004267 [Pythium insidiosum]|uniref:Globin domain-containing protein n=1 Tax=Pythium insidiosum TaxID=114742 RepID=A0AAD5LWG6_PYTIN|nr:hypothetical protein P43SY_004267 [Pythium insidiosum]